ncbi:hypothetical protein Acor_62520 [Acrocarpospora corrugata]|uniref:Lipoprotein n=1 Tax=Acrocarpospora corrugata TaxID=35763 RepID=A0A5M3W5A0_9ACTN|nr:hypothetical protein [Acrocarpospora corrugata]GES04185.1 hypothetical protein Acor_62520 [Acrocarpospora corrugata]
MGQARLRLAALGTFSVLASGIGATTAWATPAPPSPGMTENNPSEMPSEETTAPEPGGSESPSASPSTEADPTTALRQALTKSAQAKSGSGKFTFNSGDTTANGTYEYQTKPAVTMDAKVTDLTMNGKASDAKPELIVSGGAGYLNPDGLFQSPGENTPWWKVNLADLKGPHGKAVAKMFNTATVTDPATIGKVVDAYEDVKMVGTAEVEGVSVTHYTANYNLDMVKAAFGDSTAPSPMGSPGAESSPAAGVHELRSDIWVDDKGMVRKTRYRNEEGQKPQFTLTSTVTDYDQPVSVQAPPADQTKPVPPQVLQKWGLG